MTPRVPTYTMAPPSPLILGKYLIAERLATRGRKTCSWNILARQTGVVLGTVTWFGRWRCYAFNPEPQTVFNSACLRDITSFLDKVKTCRQEKTKR